MNIGTRRVDCNMDDDDTSLLLNEGSEGNEGCEGGLLPDGFGFPVGGEAHGGEVDVGVLGEEGFEVGLEIAAGVDGAEQVGDHGAAEVDALGIGLGGVNPGMDDSAGLCRTDGQEFVPDAAVVAAEVPKAAEDQEPGGEYRGLEAEVLGDFLLQGCIGQVHVDMGHVAEGQYFQQHPCRRERVGVGGLEMFDEIFLGAGVFLVYDVHQGIEAVQALVVGGVCEPEDVACRF